MKPLLRLSVLMALLLLAACNGDSTPGQYNTSSDPAVAAKADALFQAWQRGDYDAVLAEYDETFFQGRSRAQWRKHLEDLLAERGPLREWHLRRSQADSRFSGKFFIYEYETVHDGNKRLHHLMTFLWPVDEDTIKLVGHKITPWQVGEE